MVFPYYYDYLLGLSIKKNSFLSTSDVQSTTSTFSDNIPVPLIAAHIDDSQANSNDQDEDIIGEEVRPLPIDSSMDARTRALQAFLQDHTYVQITVCLP